MPRSSRAVLPAQIRVLIEPLGRHGEKRGVRRPILVHRTSGLVHELPTVHVYRAYRGKSLNTVRAVLHDLAFYVAWAALKQKRESTWVPPEARVRAGALPLTSREIDDLSNWCQRRASDLAQALQREKSAVSSIAVGAAADASTSNRRLLNIRNYLIWLIQEFVEGSIYIQDKAFARSVEYRGRVRDDFERGFNATRKVSPVRSLSDEQSRVTNDSLQTTEIFPNTAQGNRDRLIAKLLLASGLRAGELLKLITSDVNDNYKVTADKIRGVVDVVRRPNDIMDERCDEPSVKTLPGPVLIPRQLASDLMAYIIGDRRIAINRRADGPESPYLFVCHSGPRTGKPISRRNLNRIIGKLKNLPGTPSWMSPHALRHTHFTEFADRAEANGRSAAEVRAMLIKRGHWGPVSTMPEHYTKRRIERQEAELTVERNRLIEPEKQK